MTPRASDAPSFSKLALRLSRARRHAEAEEAAALAVRLAPESFDAWFVLGISRARAEDRAGAVFAYLKALAIVPSHIGCWTDLAELYIALLDYPKAVAALRQAMQLDAEAQHPAGRRARAVAAKTMARLKKQVTA